MRTAENNWGLTDGQLEEIRQHAKFSNRLRRFKNNSTIKTFEEIFGQEEGKRLIIHFITVNKDIERFISYLTTSQRNDFTVYVIETYPGDY